MAKYEILQKPSRIRKTQFLAAVARSKRLHARWLSPPATPEVFDAYLKRLRGNSYLSYWVMTEDEELAGVVNISEIVRGANPTSSNTSPESR